MLVFIAVDCMDRRLCLCLLLLIGGYACVYCSVWIGGCVYCSVWIGGCVCSVWIGGFPAGEGEKENRGGKKNNLKLSVHEYGADGFKV